MTKNRPARLLVADDDARWKAQLSRDERLDCHFTEHLDAASRLVDRRRRWAGAIFDRYLLVDEQPFSSGRVETDAGFILAVAFLRKFPDRRVVVASGQRLISELTDDWRRLLESDHCMYVYKGDAAASGAAIDFVLDGARPSTAFAAWLECLILEPNFFGLGVNLGELIRKVRGRHGEP